MDLDPAMMERLAKQDLYLGIGAAQFGCGQPFDRGVDGRVETEGESFPVRRVGHVIAYW